MDIEIRQLRYFVAVAETGNFSEAARLMNVTQGTMSQQIRQLENELGIELFIRNTHHVTLSDVGEAFLIPARQAISSVGMCMDSIRDVQKLYTGELNIGCTYTFSLLLKETLLEFMKMYPGIKVNIFCQSMEELVDMLGRNRIDLALCYKPSHLPLGMESYVLFDNRLVVVSSRSNAIARKSSVTLEELERYELALPAKGMQARNLFDSIVEKADCHLSVKLEVNEVNVLLSVVRGSRLVSVVSRATAARDSSVAHIDLKGCEGEMEGSYILNTNAYMKHATRTFLEMLSDNRVYGETID